MSGGEETTRVSYNTRRSKRLRNETVSKANSKHQVSDQDKSDAEEVPPVQIKKKSATYKGGKKKTDGEDYAEQKTLRRSTRPKKKQVSEASRRTSSTSRNSSKKSLTSGKNDKNSNESQDEDASQSKSYSLKHKREVSKSSSQVSDISDFDEEDDEDRVDDEEWKDTKKGETTKIGLSTKTKKITLPRKRRGPSLVPIKEDKLSEPDKEFCYILHQLKSENVSVKVTLDRFLDEFCPSDSDSEKAIVMYGLCQLVTLCIQTAVDHGGIEVSLFN